MRKLILFLALTFSAIASPPDCNYSFRLSNRTTDTADGVTVFAISGGAVATRTIDNRGQACLGWELMTSVEGLANVSIQLEDSATTYTTAGGSPSQWIAYQGTGVSGSNPSTSTTTSTYVATGYYPWMRVNLTASTGTGSVDITLYGWKSASLLTGVGAGVGGGMADPGANGPLIRTALNVTAPETALESTTVYSFVSAGSSNAYTGCPTQAVAALTDHLHIKMAANFTNTGAATLALCGLTAKAITKQGATAAALASGDIVTNQEVVLDYDGVQYEMQSPIGNAAPASGTVTNTAGNLTASNCAVGNGTTDIKTPSSACQVDSNGNVIANSLATGGAAVPSLPTGMNSCNFDWNNAKTFWFSWCAPTTLSQNLALSLADTVPAANSVMLFPAPTSSVSTAAWTPLGSSLLVTPGTTIGVSTANRTRTKTFSLLDWTDNTDSGKLNFEEGSAIHLTRVFCSVVGATNAVVNLDKRVEATPNTDTGNHLISDLTCITTGASTTTFSNGASQCGGTSSCAIATRLPITLTITSVSGAAAGDGLRVVVEYTID